MYNSYTSAIRLEPPPQPLVKQYKTIVGGTNLKSTPFQSHGKLSSLGVPYMLQQSFQSGGSQIKRNLDFITFDYHDIMLFS